jgi:hypothetical protein
MDSSGMIMSKFRVRKLRNLHQRLVSTGEEGRTMSWGVFGAGMGSEVTMVVSIMFEQLIAE